MAERRSFKRRIKRHFKQLGVLLLQRSPAFPTWFWDRFVHWKVGDRVPELPVVLFVQDPSLGTPAIRVPLESVPPPQEGFIRLVIISDTHERHELVKLPAADVLLHCGDILVSSSLAKQDRGARVLREFNSWLRTLPCREKVVIGGNHDKALEQLGSSAQEIIEDATLLQDSSVILPLAGIKIYGTPWSEGESNNRAWQTPEPNISDACEGADVVMSHACTKEIEDAMLRKVQPQVWASGHYHALHGVRERDGILFANAAIMDETSNPLHPPVVVDLPRRK